MRKTDVRTIKTELNIKKHFILLLKNKPLENISISELTKLCSLNRNTFYLHYRTIGDLYISIKDEVFLLFLTPLNTIHLEDLAYNPDTLISTYLSLLKDEMTKNFLFNTRHSHNLIKELIDKLSSQIFTNYKKIIYSKDTKYLVNILFILYGFFYTYRDFYLSQPLDEQFILERISLLLNKGLFKTYKNTLYR